MSEAQPQPIRKPPLSIQVRVFARLLGMDYDDIEWDHTHARALNGPHDRYNPDIWTPRTKADHKIKTFGKPATTYGSDIHAIAKMKRLEKRNADFNSRMSQKQPGRDRPRASTWPSRPFGKRKKDKRR